MEDLAARHADERVVHLGGPVGRERRDMVVVVAIEGGRRARPGLWLGSGSGSRLGPLDVVSQHSGSGGLGGAAVRREGEAAGRRGKSPRARLQGTQGTVSRLHGGTAKSNWGGWMGSRRAQARFWVTTARRTLALSHFFSTQRQIPKFPGYGSVARRAAPFAAPRRRPSARPAPHPMSGGRRRTITNCKHHEHTPGRPRTSPEPPPARKRRRAAPRYIGSRQDIRDARH